jgi:hypothetical protein
LRAEVAFPPCWHLHFGLEISDEAERWSHDPAFSSMNPLKRPLIQAPLTINACFEGDSNQAGMRKLFCAGMMSEDLRSKRQDVRDKLTTKSHEIH